MMEQNINRRKPDVRDHKAKAQAHHDYFLAMAMIGQLNIEDFPQIRMAVLREKLDVVKPLGKAGPMLPEDLN